MITIYQRRGALPLAILLSGFFAFPHGTKAADTKSSQNKDSKEVAHLLSDVKRQAAALSSDADMMETYAWPTGPSRQSDSNEMEQMRDHVNQAGKDLTQLQSMRAEASPWQAEAIDEVRPLLQELANNTEDAIKFVNGHSREDFFQPRFRDYLEANASAASRLSSMIGQFMDYGRTKHRLTTLSSQLDMPAQTSKNKTSKSKTGNK